MKNCTHSISLMNIKTLEFCWVKNPSSLLKKTVVSETTVTMGSGRKVLYSQWWATN